MQLIELKKLNTTFNNNIINITSGVSEYQEEVDSSDFVGKADKALYKGKNSGKNKIVINK